MLSEEPPMNEPCQDAVTVFPPEKSPEGEAALLKFKNPGGLPASETWRPMYITDLPHSPSKSRSQ